MNRTMIWATAMMLLVAGMTVTSSSQAEAGLFNRNKCCKPAKSRKKCRKIVCCAPAPCCAPAAPCGCEIAADPAPCGCATAAAAPSDCCEAQICCSRKSRRLARRNKYCCAQISPCGSSGGTIIEGGSNPTPALDSAPAAPADSAT